MTDNEEVIPDLDALAALNKLREDYQSLLNNPIYQSMRIAMHSKLEALGHNGDERSITDREAAIIVGEKIGIKYAIALDFYTFSAMEAELKQRRYEELQRQYDEQ